MLPFKEAPKGTFVLALPINFDFEVHKEFRNALREVIQRAPKQMIFDFSEVDYIDSAGLGMLMLARQEADAAKCGLVLRGVGEGHPRKVLEMVKFDQIFVVEHGA